MPFKHEYTKTLIPRELNRNVKLSLDDREKIREEYKYNPISYAIIGEKWGVSRRLISFIIEPEKEKRNKELQKEKGRIYYDRVKHNKYIKEHRNYKQTLYKKNKLIIGEKIKNEMG